MSSGFKIAIWGVGLIGGSLGMAWRRSGVATEVIGIGRRPLEDAVRLGAIDRYELDVARGVGEADVVVLGAPVQTIIQQAETHARFIKPGAVVTDVGSTKLRVVEAWERFLPEGTSYVGGHPMFGREVSGVENATPDLPKGSRYILTPGRRSTPEALALMERLARAAGGVVRVMSPAEHDARVAMISHLPQLVATALAASAWAGEERISGVLDLAGSGFRDTTRLADSPVSLWQDIFLTNPDAIRAALLIFRESLDTLDDALAHNDPERIARVFKRAYQARQGVKP